MSNYKVFLSCDKNFTELNNNWVQQFKVALNQLLANTLKQPVQLKTTFDFEDLKQKEIFIQEANNIVQIITQGYQHSPVVKKEVEILKKEHPEKTLKLLFTKPHKNLLINKQDTSVHKFLYREFANSKQLPSIEKLYQQKEFWLKLFDVVYELTKNKIENNLQKGTVFLSQSTPDIELEQLSIKRELIHSGYKVLPNTNYFFTKAHLEVATNEALEKSQLAVHFIGGKPGLKVDNDDEVFFQNNLAAQFCANHPKMNRLIWIPKNLIYADRDQRVAIDKLRRESTGLLGAEIVQTPIEKLKDIIHQRLQQKNNIKSLRKKDDTHTIYFIVNEKHIETAKKLQTQLQTQNVNVLTPITSNYKRELIRHHRNCLLNCDSVALFNDSGSLDWTISKHKDIIKSVGLGRKDAIHHKLFLVEDDKEKYQKNFEDYTVVNLNDKNLLNIIKTLSTQ